MLMGDATSKSRKKIKKKPYLHIYIGFLFNFECLVNVYIYHLKSSLSLSLTGAFRNHIILNSQYKLNLFFRIYKYLPTTHLFIFTRITYIRPRIKYCCHIWLGDAKSLLLGLDRVKNR